MHGFKRLFLLVMLSWLWLVFAWDAAAWQLMDVYTVENMRPAQRLQWVEQQLGSYKGQINNAAKRHRIPPRLLGAIIINELADYNIVDKGQESYFSTGSVGMAQVNVLRAISHKLVDVREEELRDYIERNYNPKTVPYAFPPNVRRWDYLSEQEKREARQFAMERIVWHRLNQPEYAIEAAAREASWIMDQMNRNLGRTWQRSLLRGPIDRADPYRNLITDMYNERDPERIRINRERALALLIIAAYNTDAIIFNDFPLDSPYYQPTSDRVPYYNARTHGINGMDLFAELFVRSQWLPTYGVPLPPIERPYETQPPGRPVRWGTFSGGLEESVVQAKVEARKKEGTTATFRSNPVTLNISQNGQASITGNVVFEGSLRGDKNGLTDTRRATFTLYNGTCKQESCSGKMTWFAEGFWPHQKPPGNYKREKPAEGTWHATGQNDGSWVLGLPNGVAPLWADIPYRLK